MDNSNIVYKIVYPALGLIVLILLIYLGYVILIDNFNRQDKKIQREENTALIQEKKFTLKEVQEASSIKENCLTIVNQKVYNIPERWANSHPGGFQNIVNMCGMDASEIFNNQHNSDEKARKALQEYLVGTLVQ